MCFILIFGPELHSFLLFPTVFSVEVAVAG